MKDSVRGLALLEHGMTAGPKRGEAAGVSQDAILEPVGLIKGGSQGVTWLDFYLWL